ncbi:hypothetical protein IFM89_039509 [Coptis chinensis]|uniref:Uncharacterized protein n=1 Tax=Coptis chinensis TaxID=261450 RepID=A0A835GWP3_9MAGN|nr:hypothetical protein IFM89_039509 [Coptis chinensis]
MDVDSFVDNPCVTTMTYNPFQTSVCPKVNEKGNEISRMKVDSVEGAPHITTKKYTLVLTPESRKIQEALNSSVLDLHDMVNDPLPDALFTAATVSADLAKEKATSVHAAEHRNEVDMDRCAQPVDKECEAVHVSRASLMERNGTARTYEWEDDTIHSSSKDLPIVHTYPAQGGGSYGRGNWSAILDNDREIFEERTAVILVLDGHQSAPVWPAAANKFNGLETDRFGFFEEVDEEFEEEMLPPHEIVARSQCTTFSVFEGLGRTLKGRDLRRVRNAVWQKTVFLD